jgi:hypothetical protein
MSWQFTVGLRIKKNADRIVVDAEDALIAALKVKAERPEATIMYVRRLNRAATRGTRLTPSPEAVDHGCCGQEFHDGERLWPGELREGGLIDLYRE